MVRNKPQVLKETKNCIYEILCTYEKTRIGEIKDSLDVALTEHRKREDEVDKMRNRRSRMDGASQISREGRQDHCH